MNYVTIFLVVFMVFLSGCQTDRNARIDIARSIATSAKFSERYISSPPFIFTTFERVTENNAPINVYIEGDGLAWIGKRTPSLDPTPTDPIALRLAAADPGKNIIYIARPCQYTKTTKNMACDQEYWTSSRFSPEVLSTMNKALDDIKTRYKASGFHVIGYSGGAAISVLLADRRKDILSLRTVAGNLDTNTFSRIHNISPLSKSLNPLDAASRISHIPQWHFVGSDDLIVPMDISKTFAKSANNPRCVHLSTIEKMTHETGWPEKWPELLTYAVTCEN